MPKIAYLYYDNPAGREPLPMLVEEIFQILTRMNKNEKLTLLLVEQNAVMALSIVQYGYIMENGRMVLDGDSVPSGITRT